MTNNLAYYCKDLITAVKKVL